MTWQKTCPGCRQTFGRGGFYSDRARPDGAGRLCKPCHRARMRAYWQTTYYPAHRAEQIAKVMARRRELKLAGIETGRDGATSC